MRNDLHEVRRWGERLIELGDERHHPNRIATALNMLLQQLARNPQQHQHEIESVITQYEQLPILDPKFFQHSTLPASHIFNHRYRYEMRLVELKRYSDARPRIKETLALGRALHSEETQAVSLGLLADLAVVEDNWHEARKWLAQCLEIRDRVQSSEAAATRVFLGLIDLYIGNIETAGALLRRAKIELEQQDNRRYLQTMTPLLFWLAVEEGRLQDAVSLLEVLEQRPPTEALRRYADTLMMASNGIEKRHPEMASRCRRVELDQRIALGETARVSTLRQLLDAYAIRCE